ncbi:MAG: glycoside hydrolase family 47 protein [Candidatus Thermoplasmatota archaeon]|nr:glycoside hydrolase family 47 protein [Candidatus Thermoplasmatota archaeon]
MRNNLFAVAIVGLMLATIFSGCVGGERKGDDNGGTDNGGGDGANDGGNGGAIDVNTTDAQRRSEVLVEFYHAWAGYVNYAWGHDILKPVSKNWSDWYGEPLLMTIVDSLDTLYLMGFDSFFFSAIEYVKKNLSFDKDIDVQVFEITIRELGGLLSAYQLSGDEGLLNLAKDLGNRLMPAFTQSYTPAGIPVQVGGIPYRYVNLKTGATSGTTTNPAEVGTLMLEFGTLSKLTGDEKYYNAAKAAMVAIYDRRAPTTNLIGSGIDNYIGVWFSPTSHVGGGIDSYYEYLWKAWVLFGDQDFKDMYDTCIAAVNQYLADEVNGMLWYGSADMVTGQRSETTFGSLHMFLPGLLAISGNVPQAEKLMESGYYMWNKWGIEPEMMDYSTMTLTSPNYELRPEIFESAYHLWKVTGDPKYKEMGYSMFQDLVQYCRTDIAYTKLNSVETKEQGDYMDSFFLAETMKYCFLLFEDSRLDYSNAVFNTEAHPLYKVSPFTKNQ